MVKNDKQIDVTWQTLFNGWQDSKINVNAQMKHLLTAGLKFLNLDVAIISKIESKTYTVEHFVGGELTKGQQFDLGHTYCSITTQNKQVVAIYNMGISEYFRHPCYEVFKLESYIGAPIIVRGNLYGTVNFSSVTPREEPFTPEQRIVVQLIGEAINWALLAQ